MTSLDLMGTHSSPVVSANKYLRFIGGYRFYQFTALPFSITTVSLSSPPKELKLMALAEGISIRQYIDDWLMTSYSKQKYQGYTHWGCILSRAWVGSNFLKIRFISNSINRSLVTIRLQGRSSLPNSKEIYCLLGKTVTMLKASHLSSGKLMSF